ncbi:two-component system, OmpR family, sensor kinase [Methylobacillus rhizosphaerae]|uniref:histidine kinase n=1 Tax=Methylobacillus rhizosphaerae TaxID=551994 RepID=A0A239ADQ0_9PROT|nr:ATP-binding protein [Methylobacillus rhizosphaerae]SNR93699.1 two-component system, OmpR family, sensor kinase [Methylobacillus rhizosphaerae]
MKSIHRYLLFSLIAALLFGTLLISLFLYKKSKHEINELYDSNMQALASVINAQYLSFNAIHQPISGVGKHSQRKEIHREEEFLVQIWKLSGEYVYASHPLIDFPRQAQSGFFTTRHKQKKWRVYTLETDQGFIQISQPQTARNLYIGELAAGLIFPLLLQIPLIGAFIWIAVGKSLRPLQRVSTAIQSRSAVSLDHLPTESLPIEICPVIDELNHLLTRLGKALAMQQSFTADAAHELRTPLAALQLQVDTLARSQDDVERHTAVTALQRGIMRAGSLVNQLLTLARLGPEFSRQSDIVELNQIVRAEIEQHLDQAVARHIDLGFSAAEPIFLEAHAASLHIMLSNLIDNAIRYSPENGKVDIRTYYTDAEVVLEVQDNASPIGSQDRERIFERFYRGSSSNGVSGSGLGLAIVADIVQQHHACITVKTRCDVLGNTFIVSFPKLSLATTLI